MLKTPTQRKNGTPMTTFARARIGEDDEVRGEEEVDRGDEPLPAHAAGERAVRVDHHDEQQRLPRGGVLLHLGAAVEKDERLARRLEQVVRGQQQEDRRA